MNVYRDYDHHDKDLPNDGRLPYEWIKAKDNIENRTLKPINYLKMADKWIQISFGVPLRSSSLLYLRLMELIMKTGPILKPARKQLFYSLSPGLIRLAHHSCSRRQLPSDVLKLLFLHVVSDFRCEWKEWIVHGIRYIIENELLDLDEKYKIISEFLQKNKGYIFGPVPTSDEQLQLTFDKLNDHYTTAAYPQDIIQRLRSVKRRVDEPWLTRLNDLKLDLEEILDDLEDDHDKAILDPFTVKCLINASSSRLVLNEKMTLPQFIQALIDYVEKWISQQTVTKWVDRCLFCHKRNHPSHQCPKYSSNRKKKRVLFFKGRCVRCAIYWPHRRPCILHCEICQQSHCTLFCPWRHGTVY